MTVSVIVPWRPTPDRAEVWRWLRARWVHAGYEVVEGHPGDGPWCKARAVGDALTRASGDILIVADADVWSDGIDEAVRAVHRNQAAWAMPHGLVRRLTPAATTAVMRYNRWPSVSDWASLEQPAYAGMPGGGLVVVSRVAYELAPLDPRFKGWGQEDECWAHALRVLVGPRWRGSASLWHLWHRPQERDSRFWGSKASEALTMRYREAGTREAMRRLVDQGQAG